MLTVSAIRPPAPRPVRRVRVLPVIVSADEPDSAKMLCTCSCHHAPLSRRKAVLLPLIRSSEAVSRTPLLSISRPERVLLPSSSYSYRVSASPGVAVRTNCPLSL
ncbi:hypothetical protein [Candidatus Electrothrix sp.]|uniref:hypothetical protein n=1 Tax=Candidatus Electrothrix sp. TaxID=2170559 RepID=UPI0040564B2D